MIVVTAFKWVPPFAQGQVRDHRIRWVLNEVGWPYEVRLIDAQDQKSAEYRADQPFGQVPVMIEDGRPTQFETGAILLDVATRAGKLLPQDEAERARAICWLFAALNSIEPCLGYLADLDFFEMDEEVKRRKRPGVAAFAGKRLGELSQALGDRDYLVGDDFTIADMMNASVLKVVGHTDMLDRFPNLVALRDRCFARPAYVKAIADQCAAFDRHGPKDMRYKG
jgi:glutathione S-transferase